MKKLLKSKKINTFLLAMVMIISLFFFVGCDGGGDGSGSYYTRIVYRPFASSKPEGSNNTYAQIISTNLTDVSKDILLGLAGEYGIGQISIKDGDSTKTVSPNLESVNLDELLNISATNEEKINLTNRFYSFTNVFYNNSKKILALTNYPATSAEIASIIDYNSGENKYIAGSSSVAELLANETISEGSEVVANKVYVSINNQKIAYVFIGGYIGPDSNKNNFLGTSNASLYVKKFYNSNFNNIQKKLGNVQFVDNASTSLPFVTWRYALTQSEFDACNNNAQTYANNFADKYKLNLAVEFAKTILTRYEGCELTPDLQTAYTQASSEMATESQKQNFILNCCEYIDHLGLMEQEVDALNNYLILSVIGENSQNYVQNCASVLNQTKTNYPVTPVLEYITIEGTPNDLVINGYIQSIVVFSKKSYEYGSAIMEVESNADAEFAFTIRYNDGEDVKEYPVSIELEDGTLTFSEIEDDGKEISLKIQPTNNIDLNDNPLFNLNENNLFVFSKDTLNTASFAWCYDGEESFVEFVFGSNSLCSNQQINISSILF